MALDSAAVENDASPAAPSLTLGHSRKPVLARAARPAAGLVLVGNESARGVCLHHSTTRSSFQNAGLLPTRPGPPKHRKRNVLGRTRCETAQAACPSAGKLVPNPHTVEFGDAGIR